MFLAGEYMGDLINALKEQFGDRLVYIGLQGSYMRGEATEDSDIDPMVVIDQLSIPDLRIYREIVDTMEYPEKSCGFICGKQDLAKWNPLEICHLQHTTKDYFGCLAHFLPEFSDVDTRNFIKLSANNLYHEITHRYIHASTEKNILEIPASYKAVFYILQNLYFLESGMFVPTKLELAERLSGIDRDVLMTAMALSSYEKFDFDSVFALLHNWCRQICERV